MKKALAIILAALMLASLIPSAFAATVNDAGNTVYNYVFSAPAIKVSNGTDIPVDENEADAMVSNIDGGVVDYDDIDVTVSDKWDIITFRSAAKKILQDKGLYFRASKSNSASPANNGVAIKLHVAETGRYIPTVLLDGCKNAGIVVAYFFSDKELKEKDYGDIVNEFSIKSIVGDGKIAPFGTVDGYASGASDDTFKGPEIKIDGAACNLEAGDYYLIACINNANETVTSGTSNYYYMNLKGMTLEKIAPASVSVTAGAKEMSVGGTTTVSAKAFDAANNELPDEIVFSSSAPSVAEVDEKTGVVTAKTAGEAIITATVAGTDIRATVEISVVKTEKYVLSAPARKKNASADMGMNAYEEADGVGYDTIDETITSPWDYVGARTLATGKFLKLGGMYYGSAMGDTKLGNNGICFKFRISEPGVYRPSLQYSEIQSGSKVNMYLITKETVAEKNYDMIRSNGESQSINGIILNSTPVLSVNTYKQGLNDQTFKTVLSVSAEGTVNLSAGDHYVILAHDGLNSADVLQGAAQQMWIKSFSMTKVGDYTPPEDAALSEAFDYSEDVYSTAPLSSARVNIFTATLGESTDSETAVITSKTVNLGELCTVEAPEAEEGYKFLYWAKGMSTEKKQIVSTENSYSFVPTVENTYLIAVYAPVFGESAENKAEFYNANGQLMKTLKEDGAAPALPEMAGYDDAEGWALYGSGEVIPGGAPVSVSGTKIYVAKYGEKKLVKVNGEDVAFGDKVSFSANPPKNEVFKAWKKNGAIVSMEETYEFRAWEDCTVEAIYVKAEPNFTGKAMKIFIDTFAVGNKSAVMAEFIGVEGAVEKGIVFGGKRIPMVSRDNQFMIINDEEESDIKGYAIFKDGTIVYDK